MRCCTWLLFAARVQKNSFHSWSAGWPLLQSFLAQYDFVFHLQPCDWLHDYLGAFYTVFKDEPTLYIGSSPRSTMLSLRICMSRHAGLHCFTLKTGTVLRTAVKDWSDCVKGYVNRCVGSIVSLAVADELWWKPQPASGCFQSCALQLWFRRLLCWLFKPGLPMLWLLSNWQPPSN